MDKITAVVSSIENTLKSLVDNVDTIAIPYLKEIEGSTKQRIHNKGLDSNNQQIGINAPRAGRYSPGYERRKKNGGIINGRKYSGSGERIYPINLQVHGNLKRSFTVGTANNKAVLRFQEDKQSEIAAFNEKNFNAEIYRPSDEQLEDMKEVLILSLEDFLRRELN